MTAAPARRAAPHLAQRLRGVATSTVAEAGSGARAGETTPALVKPAGPKGVIDVRI